MSGQHGVISKKARIGFQKRITYKGKKNTLYTMQSTPSKMNTFRTWPQLFKSWIALHPHPPPHAAGGTSRKIGWGCVACFLKPKVNSRHFETPPLFFPPKDVWETSAEFHSDDMSLPGSWVVLLICWKFASTNHEHYPGAGSDVKNNFDTQLDYVDLRDSVKVCDFSQPYLDLPYNQFPMSDQS